MARIAVNTRLLLKNKLEGIGWFAYESLKRITQQHPEHEFLFIFDRAYNEEFIFSSNVTPVVSFPQARHPVLFYLYFEYAIPSVLKKHKVDYFISPDGYLSLSTGVPSLPVIHDINFEHRPQDLPLKDRLYYRHFFPKFAKKATRISTVSEFSKKDISETYHIDPEKIDVVYNGCNTLYGPIDEALKASTRSKWTNGKPYFLFVGSLHPRKNLFNLLKAFDQFREQLQEEFKLLIVGNFMWKNDLQETLNELKHKDDVVFAGRLSNDELKPVLAGATALTFVPFFEGFGIPILEGFYSETPVITSDVTSMPEVAGDAALLADPHNVNSIADAMFKLAKDPVLAQKLVDAGKLQREKFSWDKTAALLWGSVERMMQDK